MENDSKARWGHVATLLLDLFCYETRSKPLMGHNASDRGKCQATWLVVPVRDWLREEDENADQVIDGSTGDMFQLFRTIRLKCEIRRTCGPSLLLLHFRSRWALD
jgi:hypothetical protein